MTGGLESGATGPARTGSARTGSARALVPCNGPPGQAVPGHAHHRGGHPGGRHPVRDEHRTRPAPVGPTGRPDDRHLRSSQAPRRATEPRRAVVPAAGRLTIRLRRTARAGASRADRLALGGTGRRALDHDAGTASSAAAGGRGALDTRGGPTARGGVVVPGRCRPGGLSARDGPSSGSGAGIPGRPGGGDPGSGSRSGGGDAGPGSRSGSGGSSPDGRHEPGDRPWSRPNRRRARSAQGSPRCPIRVRRASSEASAAPLDAPPGSAGRSAAAFTSPGASGPPAGRGMRAAVPSGAGDGPVSPPGGGGLASGVPASVERTGSPGSGPDGTSGTGGSARTGPSDPRASSTGRVRWNEGRVASVTSWVPVSIVTSEVATSPSTTGALRRGSTTGSPTAVGSQGKVRPGAACAYRVIFGRSVRRLEHRMPAAAGTRASAPGRGRAGGGGSGVSACAAPYPGGPPAGRLRSCDSPPGTSTR